MEYKYSLPSGMSLLKEAWHLMKSKLSVLVTLSVIVSGMSFLFEILFPTNQDGTVENVSMYFFVFLAVYAVSQFWAQLALILAVGQTVSAREAITKSPALFWPYAWASILVGFIVIGGFILLIIPGIIFSFWYSLYGYTVILENLRGMAALRKSKEYVKGYILQIIWRWLVLVPVIVVMLIPIFLLDDYKLATNIYSAILVLFSAPYLTAYQYLIYKHLKEIKFMSIPQEQPSEVVPSMV